MHSNKQQPSFDLNTAIQRWRAELEKSPSFRAEDLDELESHVRDSQAALLEHGLTAEEAFLIAVRRTGGTEAVAAEFATVNRSVIWQERLLWMGAAVVLGPLLAIPALLLGPAASVIRPLPFVLFAGMLWLQANLVRKSLKTPLRLTSILLLVALVSVWLQVSLNDFWLAAAFQFTVTVVGLSFVALLRRRRRLELRQSL